MVLQVRQSLRGPDGSKATRRPGPGRSVEADCDPRAGFIDQVGDASYRTPRSRPSPPATARSSNSHSSRPDLPSSNAGADGRTEGRGRRMAPAEAGAERRLDPVGADSAVAQLASAPPPKRACRQRVAATPRPRPCARPGHSREVLAFPCANALQTNSPQSTGTYRSPTDCAISKSAGPTLVQHRPARTSSPPTRL
jgi:hypothetical protein